MERRAGYRFDRRDLIKGLFAASVTFTAGSMVQSCRTAEIHSTRQRFLDEPGASPEYRAMIKEANNVEAKRVMWEVIGSGTVASIFVGLGALSFTLGNYLEKNLSGRR